MSVPKSSIKVEPQISVRVGSQIGHGDWSRFQCQIPSQNLMLDNNSSIGGPKLSLDSGAKSTIEIEDKHRRIIRNSTPKPNPNI